MTKAQKINTKPNVRECGSKGSIFILAPPSFLRVSLSGEIHFLSVWRHKITASQKNVRAKAECIPNKYERTTSMHLILSGQSASLSLHYVLKCCIGLKMKFWVFTDKTNAVVYEFFLFLSYQKDQLEITLGTKCTIDKSISIEQTAKECLGT